MGRSEMRKLERQKRIDSKKGKLIMSRDELFDVKRKAADDAIKYDVEALMTCFALAERRLYGFGKKRIFKSLGYIDELMTGIRNGTATMEDYKKELEEEAEVRISCD